jgi:uncharacterized protein (TIGR03663 family)
MVFLGVHLVWKLFSQRWKSIFHQIGFIAGAASGLSGLGLIFYIIFGDRPGEMLSAAETIQPLDPTSGLPLVAEGASRFGLLALILIVVGLLIAGISLVLSFGRRLRVEFPTFDLLLVSGTMILPHLAAIPGELLGWDVLAYQDPDSFLRTQIAVAVLVLISAAIGLLWDWRRWLITACVFYVPFIILQTTVLTNPSGLATGLVGSLGYWLDQQDVHRGSQPWYYYLALQIPMYEYLPALGALLAPIATFFGIIKKQDEGKTFSEIVKTDTSESGEPFPVMIFLGYWTVLALIAFSFARERMPWLTVHITLPMILVSGYTVGKLIEAIDWKGWRQRRFWLLAILLGVVMMSLVATMSYGLGDPPPFQGNDIAHLQATLGFLLALVMAIGSLSVLVVQAAKWPPLDFFKLASLFIVVLLAGLTTRTALRASFINYDDPTEFLVYAHSATGVKTVMDQVEDISLRTTDSLAVDVAYDDDVSWPFQWYLRNYTNPRFYSRNPTRDLLNYPLVIAGNDNWSRVDPILGDRYHVFEYNRMWWPMQDYFGLTWERIGNAIRTPEMRAALWDIWFDRDYEAYIALTGRPLTLENWYNADRMRLYIRKDIAALVWDYNMIPPEMSLLPGVDPYADGMQELQAVQVIGAEAGVTPGQFMHPRDVAIAPDGTIYVADTENHRIQHFNVEGVVLNTWGEFGQVADGQGGLSQIFNAPWGLAVGPSGDVYVADTWNDRVMQFTSEGELLNTVGLGDLASPGDGMWGPRGVAVGSQGRVFVSDTGNKRILIFDDQLNYLGEFGGGGAGTGRLDEPVGLAIDGDGRVYVADTWNMRVQVFEEIDENWFIAVLEWPIEGWYGNSLDNKPYLAYSPSGHICASDPEGFLVLCFTTDGTYVSGWGGLGSSDMRFGLPTGMAFDASGAVWVVDSGNNRIMRFFPDLP